MSVTNCYLVKRNAFLPLFSVIVLSACNRSSSPEGRMSMKLENLQKEMIDSLMNQNRAILETLHEIREDLKDMREDRK